MSQPLRRLGRNRIFSSVEPNQNPEWIRQNRIDLSGYEFFIEIGGFKLPVVNLSSFGVAVRAFQDVTKVLHSETNPRHSEVPLLFKEQEVQRLSLRMARTEPTKAISTGGDVLIAFEVIDAPCALGRIQAIIQSSDLVAVQDRYRKELESSPKELRIAVWEIKEWLAKFKIEIEKQQDQIGAELSLASEDGEEFQNTLVALLGEHIRNYMVPQCGEIVESMAHLTEQGQIQAMNFLQKQLGELIYSCPLASRALRKPSGLAGDYQVLNLIGAEGAQGANCYEQALHAFFVSLPALQAMRYRNHYFHQLLARYLATETFPRFKILSLNGGASVELTWLFRDLPSLTALPIEIHCMDQDAEALKFVQKQLRVLQRNIQSTTTLKFSKLPLQKLLFNGVAETRFNLIYVPNLFDYLEDTTVYSVVGKLFAGLEKHGEIVISNFGVQNPSRAIMEILMDWHVIGRSPECYQHLLKDLGAQITHERDPLGIINYIKIQKN